MNKILSTLILCLSIFSASAETSLTLLKTLKDWYTPENFEQVKPSGVPDPVYVTARNMTVYDVLNEDFSVRKHVFCILHTPDGYEEDRSSRIPSPFSYDAFLFVVGLKSETEDQGSAEYYQTVIYDEDGDILFDLGYASSSKKLVGFYKSQGNTIIVAHRTDYDKSTRSTSYSTEIFKVNVSAGQKLPTAISDNEIQSATYYSIDGTIVSEDAPGVVVVRQSNGTVQKQLHP